MRPEERDIALLWGMREAAREVADFTRGVTYAEFTSRKVLRYAVERQITVIGEAARRVSDSFKRAHPEIPWGSIIGQRNVLAHLPPLGFAFPKLLAPTAPPLPTRRKPGPEKLVTKAPEDRASSSPTTTRAVIPPHPPTIAS
jgi:uncharacterized protein with HEPN domain